MSKIFPDLHDAHYNTIHKWAGEMRLAGKLYSWGWSDQDDADSATIWVPLDTVYEEPLVIDGLRINIVRTSYVDPE